MMELPELLNKELLLVMVWLEMYTLALNCDFSLLVGHSPMAAATHLIQQDRVRISVPELPKNSDKMTFQVQVLLIELKVLGLLYSIKPPNGSQTRVRISSSKLGSELHLGQKHQEYQASIATRTKL